MVGPEFHLNECTMSITHCSPLRVAVTGSMCVFTYKYVLYYIQLTKHPAIKMPDEACALELYDLQKDPEERHNLIAVNFDKSSQLIVSIHFTGESRQQTFLGCPAEKSAYASLPRNGSSRLPTRGFC